jgi:hypothetical protein
MLAFSVALPAGGTLEALEQAQNLRPFGQVQQAFAAALSRRLTTSPATRVHPELVALGFWLRAANITRVARVFEEAHRGRIYLPRGLVFHIAPSNVDTIFVYSWFISLLCGNRNVVRISSKESPQTAALLSVLGDLLARDEWQEIATRTLVVRYGHEAATTASLSARCDMRVVWGGDETVKALRAFALSPHATELAFANKFSACVLDAQSVLDASPPALGRLAQNFYNDSYWFGQMACSSPRMVFWLGDEKRVHDAAARFWPAIARELDVHSTELAAADSVNKEVAVDSLAIEERGVHIDTEDHRMTRVWMPTTGIHDRLHCGAGLFHETRIDELRQLVPRLSRKIQTISQYGVAPERWIDFLHSFLPTGIDRVVPVGRALDFEPVWDGFDLLISFLREVTVIAPTSRD